MFDVSGVFYKGFLVTWKRYEINTQKRNGVGHYAPLFLMFIDFVFILTKECACGCFKPTYGVSSTAVVGTIPALESGTRTVL